jgi:hypothetical protein
MMFRKPVTIHGHDIPRRRFTFRAALYFALFVALPVLGMAALLDYALYSLADRIGGCYAVFCLFG